LRGTNAIIKYIIKAHFLGRMELFSKLSSKREKYKTRSLLRSKIKTSTKEPLKIIRPMARENSYVKMDLIILENGWITCLMA
jgi:hypothetical protein